MVLLLGTGFGLYWGMKYLNENYKLVSYKPPKDDKPVKFSLKYRDVQPLEKRKPIEAEIVEATSEKN